jgi:NADH:ubiquinone oxidoreductase subunit F (NADH-binding)
MGFFDESCKECNKCRESEACKTIKSSEQLSKEFGKIKKNDRKNINHILKVVKGGQLF